MEAGQALSARAVAERSGLDYDKVRRTIGRMADAGEVGKAKRGLFVWEGAGNAGNG
jgi:predicted transcriptional regulator